MHASLAIKTENLSKQYIIGERAAYTTLRDSLSKIILQPLRYFSSEEKPHIWALKDASFEVKKGEVLGIIGKNGSGKTTLLKILSRITEPTSGSAKIRGRVASLLEVGTGFHQELTGRENIFLNGAILGMTRKEIKKKFDEIVEFSGVERFLDTPVKRYSSGMYVRLAFAVAAHLESEILLVDEVLAVGDIEFQKKSLGKMQEMTVKHGRTVLFVSHNLNAIEQLCSRVILLEEGTLITQGLANKVVKTYINKTADLNEKSYWEKGERLGNQFFSPIRFFVANNSFQPIKVIRSDETNFIVVEFECREVLNNLMVGYQIYDGDNRCIYTTTQADSSPHEWPLLKTGKNLLYSYIPKRLLKEGRYRLELISKPHGSEWIIGPGKNSPTISFTVQGGQSESPYWSSRSQNLIVPIIPWYKK